MHLCMGICIHLLTRTNQIALHFRFLNNILALIHSVFHSYAIHRPAGVNNFHQDLYFKWIFVAKQQPWAKCKKQDDGWLGVAKEYKEIKKKHLFLDGNCFWFSMFFFSYRTYPYHSHTTPAHGCILMLKNVVVTLKRIQYKIPVDKKVGKDTKHFSTKQNSVNGENF